MVVFSRAALHGFLNLLLHNLAICKTTRKVRLTGRESGCQPITSKAVAQVGKRNKLEWFIDPFQGRNQVNRVLQVDVGVTQPVY